MKKLFTHLNLRSSYSLVDSTINLNSLIKRAKSQKMPTLALTDFTNIFNLVKFYQKSIENKIKPILGCQIPLMEFNNKYQNPYITLLCKNHDGYKNMIKITPDIKSNIQQHDSCEERIDFIKDKYSSGALSFKYYFYSFNNSIYNDL